MSVTACAQTGLAADDLFGVSFSDRQQGWACGRWGTILHTDNGGQTWSAQRSGTEVTLAGIHFTDQGNGWAVGDNGTILHTTNGGTTWKTQKSPVSFFMMDVFFATPHKGWAVTEQTTILATDDGGRTWKVQFSDEDLILKAVSFADPQNGWAVGEYGCIYYTSSGGETWQKQAGYFEISDENGEPTGAPFLFDVAAVDTRTAWVSGIDGYVASTCNGGVTWNRVRTGAPPAHLFSICTSPGGSIAVGGNGTLLVSIDKGCTWRMPELNPPVTYGWLYGITPKGTSGFAAVGWQGAMYLSDEHKDLAAWKAVDSRQ